MTETEKYIKTAESREVSGSTVDTQEFVPEFKPFRYGTEIAQEETAFEVEKQYNFDANKYSFKENEPARMDFPTVEKNKQERAEIVAKREIVARPQLNARGKIVASVFAIIVAIMVAFCIYNAVSINGLERAIAAKSQIALEQSQVITELQNTYNSLGEEENILSRLEGSYRRPSASDIQKLEKFEMSQREIKEEQSNWFERFCKKLSHLFG